MRGLVMSKINKNLFIITSLFFLSSCLEVKNGERSRKDYYQSFSNIPSTVSPYYGRYFRDNPIALSQNKNLEANGHLGAYLGSSQFITDNPFLIGSCRDIDECFAVKADSEADYLTEELNRWAFPVPTSSFRQVQTFGNIRDISHRFLEWLLFSFETAQKANYTSAHPKELFSPTLRPYWLRSHTEEKSSEKLMAYSDCNSVEDNAYFSPAKNEICLGKLSFVNNFYFTLDPTITWHEAGHAFNKILLNTRNMASPQNILVDTELGYHFYDEAGAIGEGISDYWSFAMNLRTHMGEWALGRYLYASRPLSEDDPLHISFLNTNSSNRLSYPHYIHYDSNDPQIFNEDIHMAGQVISHFLTAFTFEVEKRCGVELIHAVRYIVHLMMESFAELGDQTSLGFDNSGGKRVNHGPQGAP